MRAALHGVTKIDDQSWWGRDQKARWGRMPTPRAPASRCSGTILSLARDSCPSHLLTRFSLLFQFYLTDGPQHGAKGQSPGSMAYNNNKSGHTYKTISNVPNDPHDLSSQKRGPEDKQATIFTKYEQTIGCYVSTLTFGHRIRFTCPALIVSIF